LFKLGQEQTEIERLFEIFKDKIENQMKSLAILTHERKRIAKCIFDTEKLKYSNPKLIEDIKAHLCSLDAHILNHVNLNECFIDFVYKLCLKFNYYYNKNKMSDLFRK
jgi:hypothetical protein